VKNPPNANHHFVPKFYLRNFALGKTIGVYDLVRGCHSSSRWKKGECHLPYLYGEDLSTEYQMRDLENVAAPIIKSIIKERIRPSLGTKQYSDFLQFIFTQWERTPAAKKYYIALLENASKAAVCSGIASKEMAKEALDQTRVKLPLSESNRFMSNVSRLIEDLELAIVINNSREEFLTSDAPVVLFNQWCQNLLGSGSTGIISSGIQIFFPLSPRCLAMLYDSDVYTVGKNTSEPSTIELNAEYDVIGINMLQLSVADEKLYYSGSQSTAASIDRLPLKKWRPWSKSILKSSSHYYLNTSSIKLNVGFIKIRNSAKGVPLIERANRYRVKAQQADREINDALYDSVNE
jgi:hypothetical protein